MKNYIRIECLADKNKTIFYKASQLFLGCGTASTTLIMLRSMKHYNKPVYIKDSQHILVPMFLLKRFSNLEEEKLYTLCQLTISISNKKISEYPCYIQLYTYNDIYKKLAEHRLGKLFSIIKPLIKILLDHLIVMQVYLHSAESGKLKILMHPDEAVTLSAIKSKKSNTIINKLLWGFLINAKKIGMIPFFMCRKTSQVGRSNHIGGSFPMYANSKLATDKFGVISGWEGVHIIDSSIFPTIPAESITTTIMANAFRIGKECSIEK